MYSIFFISGRNTMQNFKDIIEQKYVNTEVRGTNDINAFIRIFYREHIKTGIDALIVGNVNLDKEHIANIVNVANKIQNVIGDNLKVFVFNKGNDTMTTLSNELTKSNVSHKVIKTEMTLNNLEKYALYDIYKEVKVDVKPKLHIQTLTNLNERFYR